MTPPASPSYAVVDVLSRTNGCDILEVKLAGFPVEAPARPTLLGLLEFLWRNFPKANQAADLYLQFSGLHLGAGELLGPNFVRWMPEQGTAYWCAHSPPHLLTLDEFYKLDPGGPVVVPGQAVFRVTIPAEIPHCLQTLLGLGSLVFVLSEKPEGEFLKACRALYEPKITESIFTLFPLYCPILDRASLLDASAEALREWLPGATLYVRESLEDKSLLIASFCPLVETMLTAGAVHPKGRQNQIHVPIGK